MAVSYLPEGLPISVQVLAGGALLFLLAWVYSTLSAERPFAGFPVISLSEKGLSPKASWFKHGRETVAKGVQQYKGPFQILTGTGPKLVVPNRFADELKSDDRLNFTEAMAKDFFPDYPGFEAHKQGLDKNSVTVELVRVKLTQSLGLITNDLVEETTMSVHDYFGEDTEWHSTKLKKGIQNVVARLSSRVFLGRKLCRNERWLEIATSYTIDSFIASAILRTVPALLRPVAHWFIPHCQRCRKEYADATKIIMPEVERRTERARKALEAGQKPPKTADTIGWAYELARGQELDYVGTQLGLTLAAIHTTTETLAQAMLDIVMHPEVVQPLREEIIAVVGAEGWQKTALYKLRLMDSFLKESQRMTPMATTSMNRMVKSPIQLSDGTILPVGARIVVAGKYADPEVYPNPGTFDAYRFLHMREQPGQNSSWQHVTTSKDHMAFGHGKHACPGRFFASNELKIALSHLLLKYDWEMEDPLESQHLHFEGACSTRPDVKVKSRRRKEEIILDLKEGDEIVQED